MNQHFDQFHGIHFIEWMVHVTKSIMENVNRELNDLVFRWIQIIFEIKGKKNVLSTPIDAQCIFCSIQSLMFHHYLNEMLLHSLYLVPVSLQKHLNAIHLFQDLARIKLLVMRRDSSNYQISSRTLRCNRFH